MHSTSSGAGGNPGRIQGTDERHAPFVSLHPFEARVLSVLMADYGHSQKDPAEREAAELCALYLHEWATYWDSTENDRLAEIEEGWVR